MHRHDALTLDEMDALDPDAVLVSPGPGPSRGRRPVERRDPALRRAGVPGARRVPRAPVHRRALRRRGRARAAGDARQDVGDPPPRRRRVRRAPEPARPRPATTRSSSTRDSVPDVLEITAESDDGLVMGLRHRELPDRRRAVPPRVDPHRRRPRPAAQLPGRARDRARHAQRQRTGRCACAPVIAARPSSTSDARLRRRGRRPRLVVPTRSSRHHAAAALAERPSYRPGGDGSRRRARRVSRTGARAGTGRTRARGRCTRSRRGPSARAAGRGRAAAPRSRPPRLGFALGQPRARVTRSHTRRMFTSMPTVSASSTWAAIAAAV